MRRTTPTVDAESTIGAIERVGVRGQQHRHDTAMCEMPDREGTVTDSRLRAYR
jgi:hypothetical protein